MQAIKSKPACFVEAARIMSNASLLDIAEANGWRSPIAKRELMKRVQCGDIDDLDFSRACNVLNLA